MRQDIPPNPAGDTNADNPANPNDFACVTLRCGPEPLVENGIMVKRLPVRAPLWNYVKEPALFRRVLLLNSHGDPSKQVRLVWIGQKINATQVTEMRHRAP